jgi:hypothetical protein
LETAQLHLVQLICNIALQVGEPPCVMRCLAVRGVARGPVLWRHCRTGVGHRGRRGGSCHCRSRHRAWTRQCRSAWVRASAIRCQSRPAGVWTRHAHRISARWIGWLGPQRGSERKYGDQRRASQEVPHVDRPPRQLKPRLNILNLVIPRRTSPQHQVRLCDKGPSTTPVCSTWPCSIARPCCAVKPNSSLHVKANQSYI